MAPSSGAFVRRASARALPGSGSSTASSSTTRDGWGSSRSARGRAFFTLGSQRGRSGASRRRRPHVSRSSQAGQEDPRAVPEAALSADLRAHGVAVVRSPASAARRTRCRSVGGRALRRRRCRSAPPAWPRGTLGTRHREDRLLRPRRGRRSASASSVAARGRDRGRDADSVSGSSSRCFPHLRRLEADRPRRQTRRDRPRSGLLGKCSSSLAARHVAGGTR